eukprot:TRINITY_DN68339_c0_g1_i1.p4 TRINITY_DN68339_c0_g1~~TRINITY_DN68339_c0_g1_i1.p4  ORF type:complete len:116 (-),score=9.88 TRINITY_DN68339_c0_g1_i1:132-479(-)
MREDIDPAPLDADGNTNALADIMREDAITVWCFPLEDFKGHPRRALARRYTIAVLLWSAAYFLECGYDSIAQYELLLIRRRIDGDPWPRDWMCEGPNRDWLLEEVDFLLDVIPLL